MRKMSLMKCVAFAACAGLTASAAFAQGAGSGAGGGSGGVSAGGGSGGVSAGGGTSGAGSGGVGTSAAGSGGAGGGGLTGNLDAGGGTGVSGAVSPNATTFGSGQTAGGGGSVRGVASTPGLPDGSGVTTYAGGGGGPGVQGNSTSVFGAPTQGGTTTMGYGRVQRTYDPRMAAMNEAPKGMVTVVGKVKVANEKEPDNSWWARTYIQVADATDQSGGYLPSLTGRLIEVKGENVKQALQYEGETIRATGSIRDKDVTKQDGKRFEINLSTATQER